MSGPNVNLQESFLNHVRKEGIQVEVTLLSGAKIQGQVRGFDNFTVIMHVDGMQHLIYKHAIAELIAPKFPSRPRPEIEEGQTEKVDGNHAPAQAPRQHAPRRRENVRAEQKADAMPESKQEPQQEKREPVRAEKFNPIDLSGIKLELEKTPEKASE